MDIVVRFLRALYVCALAWLIAFALWWTGDLIAGASGVLMMSAPTGEGIEFYLLMRALAVPFVGMLALSGYWLVAIVALILAIVLDIRFLVRRKVYSAIVGIVAALVIVPFAKYLGLPLEPIDTTYMKTLPDLSAGMQAFLAYGFPVAMAAAGYYLGDPGRRPRSSSDQTIG